MAKEFIYTKTKEIGKLEENATVEIGHYKVDGKDMPDKVYLVNNDALIFYGRKLHMEKIFCETKERFLEMQRRYDLEDCGISGLYPEYHWYQDSNANVAVYMRCCYVI